MQVDTSPNKLQQRKCEYLLPIENDMKSVAEVPAKVRFHITVSLSTPAARLYTTPASVHS